VFGFTAVLGCRDAYACAANEVMMYVAQAATIYNTSCSSNIANNPKFFTIDEAAQSCIASGDAYHLNCEPATREQWLSSIRPTTPSRLGGWEQQTTWPGPAACGFSEERWRLSFNVGTVCVAPPLYVAPPEESAEACPTKPATGSSCKAGNPIDLPTGRKLQVEADYTGTSSPAGARLFFKRYYSSAATAEANLAPGWRHSYSSRVVPQYSTSKALGFRLDQRSSYYTDEAQACEEGWLQVRNSTRRLRATTAVYEGACNLYQGATLVRSIPVFGPGDDVATSTVSAWKAERPDGSFEYFGETSAAVLPPVAVGGTATLTRTSTGFDYVSGVTTESYDTNGRLQSVQTAGDKLLAGYDGSGRLQTVSNAFGRSLTLTYDGSGRLSSLVDPAGQSYIYGYDGTGNLASVTYPGNEQRQYHYEDSRFPYALTGISDAGVRYATWNYDDAGRAVLSEHAGGADRVTVRYNSDGTVAAEDSRGLTRTYHFLLAPNGAARVSLIYDSCASGCPVPPLKETYDANGFLASRTDRKGYVTLYSHNSRGLEESRTEASGTPKARTITTAWHPVLALPQEVNEPGRRTTFTYDASGRLETRTITDTASGQSQTTTYHYDALDRLETVDGPRTEVSDVTTFGYDAYGNLTAITNPLVQTIQITQHDAHGNPLNIVDANSVETVLAYDLRQRLKTRTTAGEVTGIDYKATGLLEKVTAPDGSWIQYDYDAAHRLTDISDQDANRIHYTLDAAGNRTAEEVYDSSNLLRRNHTRIYNALSRLKQDLGGNGQVTLYNYDANGNVVSDTVDGSYVTTNTYDQLNRLFKVTDAANGLTQYGYNALDQLTSVTDPRGLVTTYTVNAFGDVTQLQSPDIGTTTSTYDSAGNLKTRTDAKGQTSTYSYDALNRLTQVVYSNGSTVTYTYDQGANGKGRLTGMTDGSGSSNWTYDALGRVATRTQSIGVISHTTAYDYDSAGRLIELTLPSGKRIGYNWVGNKITGVTLNDNPLASNLSWEPFGPASGWSFANGEQVAKTYDLSGRMTGHSLGTIGYNTADRIRSLTHGGVSHLAGTKTYGYDDLHRLTSYSGFGVEIGYGYDANGNRSEQTGTTGTVTSVLDSASNRLTGLTNSGGSQGFQYDDNGSMTSDGVKTYGYDAAGRLTAVTPNASYVYNGLGQRTRKTVGIGGTTFVYDEAGHLLGEYNGLGGAIRENVWLGDTPIAVLRGANTYYVHADHLNTPRQIDNQAGEPVWLWDAITFGASAPDQDPMSTGAAFVYNLRHPGQYYDAETGLFQNWHRDYSALLGRYIQSDPIGLLGGLNTYLYAEANPLMYTDPLGLKTFMCTAPLHALGGDGARSGLDVSGNPLYHQYLCVNDGKGGYKCGGQDQRGQKWYDPLNGPGKPSEDKYDPQTCKQKEPDNDCIEQCLLKKFAGPRPRYGIPFGTDCQEWSADALKDCQKQCKKK